MTYPQCKEIKAASALNKLKRKIPYGWDLNIYRGCGHGCRYCYALYSHDYLGDENFFGNIYVKSNIVEILEKELSAPTWQREIVNLGGVTDSYQPAEEHYKLMPEILKLMIKYKTPIIISSKSDLILRDYDLIDQLSRLTLVNIAQTITTMDENIRGKIEPFGSPSLKRFEVLKEFRKTNASIGLHVMPIIPFLTDFEKNLDELFAQGAKAKVDYALTGTLYLRGKTRSYFMDFIKKEYPSRFENFCALYKKGGADKDYKDALYQKINRLRAKHKVSSAYMKPLRERLPK